MAIIRKEFSTQIKAQELIDFINAKLGIPVSEDSTAQFYTDWIQDEETGLFYVDYDDEVVTLTDE